MWPFKAMPVRVGQERKRPMVGRKLDDLLVCCDEEILWRSESVQGCSDSGLLELLAPVWGSTIHGLWNASKWMWLHGAKGGSGLRERRESAESSRSWESGWHFDGWEW